MGLKPGRPRQIFSQALSLALILSFGGISAHADSRCSNFLLSLKTAAIRLLPNPRTHGGVDGLHLVENHPVYRLESGHIEGWTGSSAAIPNKGTSNAGTYLLKSPSGEASVLRIIPQEVNAKVPTFFLQSIEGMALQSLEGGPRILDFGTVITESGKTRFFIRMECLFCGQHAENLKDLDYGSENLVSNLELRHHDVLGRFGDALAITFTDHILPVDPDFFISESGEARWIDGERWKAEVSLKPNAYEFAESFWTLLEYSKRAMSAHPELWPEASQSFLSNFFSRIRASVKLSPAEKTALLSQILRGKANQWCVSAPVFSVIHALARRS
ncbi:MAG: hypothetical protein EBX52_03755 [Proteobacteria bacterium]|nr:hypothetical protein [Pseudomonadota bacterium]